MMIKFINHTPHRPQLHQIVPIFRSTDITFEYAMQGMRDEVRKVVGVRGEG